SPRPGVGAIAPARKAVRAGGDVTPRGTDGTWSRSRAGRGSRCQRGGTQAGTPGRNAGPRTPGCSPERGGACWVVGLLRGSQRRGAATRVPRAGPRRHFGPAEARSNHASPAFSSELLDDPFRGDGGADGFQRLAGRGVALDRRRALPGP